MSCINLNIRVSELFARNEGSHNRSALTLFSHISEEEGSVPRAEAQQLKIMPIKGILFLQCLAGRLRCQLELPVHRNETGVQGATSISIARGMITAFLKSQGRRYTVYYRATLACSTIWVQRAKESTWDHLKLLPVCDG